MTYIVRRATKNDERAPYDIVEGAVTVNVTEAGHLALMSEGRYPLTLAVYPTGTWLSASKDGALSRSTGSETAPALSAEYLSRENKD